MTYWSSVWREAMKRPDHAFRSHSEAELAAFNRSRRRGTPGQRTRPSSRSDRAAALRKIVAANRRLSEGG